MAGEEEGVDNGERGGEGQLFACPITGPPEVQVISNWKPLPLLLKL